MDVIVTAAPCLAVFNGQCGAEASIANDRAVRRILQETGFDRPWRIAPWSSQTCTKTLRIRWVPHQSGTKAKPSQHAALAVGSLGVFALVRDRRHRHCRGRRRDSGARTAQSDETSARASGTAGNISLLDVERYWQEMEALGVSTEKIARQCALLCCVQRRLGYFAALHEGAVGNSKVISKAPPLPLVLTWLGAGGLDEVYGMSLGMDKNVTLLDQLLGCAMRAQRDTRSIEPSEDSELRAQVSLLHGFTDISTTPDDWTQDLHGLWYVSPEENGHRSMRVYLPDVACRLADGKSGMAAVRQVLNGELARDEAEDVDTEDEDGGSLPEGHTLYRFEALNGIYPVANLPTMKTRERSDKNEAEMLYSQARMRPEEAREGAPPRYAALVCKSQNTQVRAFVVPNSGTYTNAELGFRAGIGSTQLTGLEKVRRIFVLAPVWDCYIDGCGIPERRCAWYGDQPLDLVVLEQLRRSKSFSELTVEQDMRERSVEALLPITESCLADSQMFTLVPVLVGGLTVNKAEQYASLFAPYLSDPANLFVVAGDVEELGENIDSPSNWLREIPSIQSRVEPILNALEFFLAVLGKVPQREELSFSRFW